MINEANPKHSDVLLVTGPVTMKVADRLRNLYNQMPEPKLVIAVGNCACTGAPFNDCYNVHGGIGKIIPVDVFVPGCAARPEAIIDGVVLGLQVWRRRSFAPRSGDGADDKSEVKK